jgi:hypothetical protein
MDDEIRHSVDNGIWLCEMCAALIDKNDGVGYPTPLLMQWKYKAEQKARAALEQPKLALSEPFPEIQAVSYVNLPRLIDMAERRGITTEWPTLEPGQWLHDLGGSTRMVMSLAKRVIGALSIEALPINALAAVDIDASGLMVSFAKQRFFTKNGPRLERSRSKPYPLDNWQRAPHLHTKIGGRKVVLVYDPRWLTATTAFVEMNNGQTTFAGLAVLKVAHPDDPIVIASPIVLGWPKPLIDFYEQYDKYVRGKDSQN